MRFLRWLTGKPTQIDDNHPLVTFFCALADELNDPLPPPLVRARLVAALSGKTPTHSNDDPSAVGAGYEFKDRSPAPWVLERIDNVDSEFASLVQENIGSKGLRGSSSDRARAIVGRFPSTAPPSAGTRHMTDVIRRVIEKLDAD